MKSKLLQILKVALVALLLFAVLDSSNASAANLNPSELGFGNISNVPGEPDASINGMSFTVDFKSVVIGYVTAVAFIYATGKSAEDWGVLAVEKTVNNLKSLASQSWPVGTRFYVTDTGNINGCAKFPCPVTNGVLPEEELAE